MKSVSRLPYLLSTLVVTAGLYSAQLAWPGDSDSSVLHRIDAQTAQGLRELFRPTTEPLPFVSAHRGGARAGYPENCFATFKNTLVHSFAIMEVDPRYTKDGEIVLHHDATLGRTTTGEGRVIDHTLAELKRLRLKDPDGKVTEHQIPTLIEALNWARGADLIETDIPTELGLLLSRSIQVPESKRPYFLFSVTR
jgi:glycerophosphoryl diester phosphodiesterase